MVRRRLACDEIMIRKRLACDEIMVRRRLACDETTLKIEKQRMENIKKSIYSRPEIRHSLKPLWTAWIIVALGVVCAFVYLVAGTMSAGVSSALLGGIIVGACSLVLVLCYYLFGDSRRPYSKTLHQRLEPTLVFYANNVEQQLVDALNSLDEKALANVKKSSNPELLLMRYSNDEETVYYSQLLRQIDSKRLEPITDIIVNDRVMSET